MLAGHPGGQSRAVVAWSGGVVGSGALQAVEGADVGRLVDGTAANTQLFPLAGGRQRVDHRSLCRELKDSEMVGLVGRVSSLVLGPTTGPQAGF